MGTHTPGTDAEQPTLYVLLPIHVSTHSGRVASAKSAKSVNTNARCFMNFFLFSHFVSFPKLTSICGSEVK